MFGFGYAAPIFLGTNVYGEGEQKYNKNNNNNKKLLLFSVIIMIHMCWKLTTLKRNLKDKVLNSTHAKFQVHRRSFR
jgi:hypothetical protein